MHHPKHWWNVYFCVLVHSKIRLSLFFWGWTRLLLAEQLGPWTERVCVSMQTCSAVSKLLVSLSRALVASSSSSSLSCASFSVEICPSAVPMSRSPCCTSCCSRATCREERQTVRARRNYSVTLQAVAQCGSNLETTSAFYAQRGGISIKNAFNNHFCFWFLNEPGLCTLC